jgi:hypothetical protein
MERRSGLVPLLSTDGGNHDALALRKGRGELEQDADSRGVVVCGDRARNAVHVRNEDHADPTRSAPDDVAGDPAPRQAERLLRYGVAELAESRSDDRSHPPLPRRPRRSLPR